MIKLRTKKGKNEKKVYIIKDRNISKKNKFTLLLLSCTKTFFFVIIFLYYLLQ